MKTAYKKLILLFFFECNVLFTFADIVFSLRMEYKKLKLKKRRVTVSMVSEWFIGNGKCGSSSTIVKAQTAMSLPMAVENHNQMD